MSWAHFCILSFVTIQVCSLLFWVVFFWLIYSLLCFPDGVILWLYMLHHVSSFLAYGFPFHSLNAFKKWTEVLKCMSLVLHFKVVFVCGMRWDSSFHTGIWLCQHYLLQRPFDCHWGECRWWEGLENIPGRGYHLYRVLTTTYCVSSTVIVTLYIFSHLFFAAHFWGIGYSHFKNEKTEIPGLWDHKILNWLTWRSTLEEW